MVQDTQNKSIKVMVELEGDALSLVQDEVKRYEKEELKGGKNKIINKLLCAYYKEKYAKKSK